MMTKIFTVLGGRCPFGCNCEIDSTECRKCEHFYRVGTATFFWCKHPVTSMISKPEKEKKKAGRPKRAK